MAQGTGATVQKAGAYVAGDASILDGVFVGHDQIEQLIEMVEKMFQGTGAAVQRAGAHVAGDVNIRGGDFVGRDKIIKHQRIIQIFDLGPDVKEAIISLANRSENLADVTKALSQPPSAQAVRQLREFELAQQATPDIPLTGESAYQFGLAAAYRRDYPAALDYFGAVPSGSDRFRAACEAIAWLQQSLAMRDIQRRDYPPAQIRLDAAKHALDRIESPGVHTYELYGYIAKSLAQIADGQGDHAERDSYYAEATTQFERALELDPSSAGTANGLGNMAYAAGDCDRAIEAYQRAIELNPNYTAAHQDLGLAYKCKLKTDTANRAVWLDKAIAAFRKAAELAPNDPGFAQDYPARIENHVQSLRAQYGEYVA